MNLLLERYCYGDQGTFGKLYLPDLTLETVELPWRHNQLGVSCIPEGVYQIRRGTFSRGGYPNFELLDVPNRSAIEFHRGNRAADLRGCIAPGLRTGCVGGNWAVLDSTEAFEQFMAAMRGQEIATLTIRATSPAILA